MDRVTIVFSMIAGSCCFFKAAIMVHSPIVRNPPPPFYLARCCEVYVYGTCLCIASSLPLLHYIKATRHPLFWRCLSTDRTVAQLLSQWSCCMDEWVKEVVVSCAQVFCSNSAVLETMTTSNVTANVSRP